jgi:hypothetical protein
MPLEDLHEARKIEQRSSESVDLIDQYAVDDTGLDVG